MFLSTDLLFECTVITCILTFDNLVNVQCNFVLGLLQMYKNMISYYPAPFLKLHIVELSDQCLNQNSIPKYTVGKIIKQLY